MASKITSNYLPELIALIFGRSKPVAVTVNLTNRCNQNCIYCEIGKGLPSIRSGTLTIEDVRWVIDQMALNKMTKISLCGGEPFLFDGIIDVVSYAGLKNIKCSITSNGMSAPMLNESELDILRKYKTEINISIDSFQDNIQSYTRGAPVSLQNALKSVRKISEKGIQLSILTVITKYNYHDLFNFLVTAYEKGIKQVLFQPVIYYTNYPDRHPVDNKAQLNVSVDKLDILMEELRKILQFEKKHNINTNVYRILPWIRYYLESIESKNGKWFFDKILKKFFCRDTFAVIDISYDGGIQPCFLTLAKSSIHENRHLGLMNLWYNATIEIRDNLNNGRYYEYCNSCCNHFSRNMLASIMKYPFQNRSALIKMFWLLIERFLSKIYK